MTEQPASPPAAPSPSGGLGSIFGAQTTERGGKLRSRLVTLAPVTEDDESTPADQPEPVLRRRPAAPAPPGGDREEQAAAPETAEDPTGAPRPHTPPPPPARRGRGRPRGPANAPASRRAASEAAELTPEPVVMYVSSSLREAMKAYRRRERTTYAELIMDAVETTHADGRLAAAFQPRSTGGLFRRGPRRVVDLDNAGGNSMVNFKLAGDNLGAIDDLWPEMGAPSRTRFLSTAVALFLDVEI